MHMILLSFFFTTLISLSFSFFIFAFIIVMENARLSLILSFPIVIIQRNKYKLCILGLTKEY